jgi:hypothetical protein
VVHETTTQNPGQNFENLVHAYSNAAIQKATEINNSSSQILEIFSSASRRYATLIKSPTVSIEEFQRKLASGFSGQKRLDSATATELNTSIVTNSVIKGRDISLKLASDIINPAKRANPREAKATIEAIKNVIKSGIEALRVRFMTSLQTGSKITQKETHNSEDIEKLIRLVQTQALTIATLQAERKNWMLRSEERSKKSSDSMSETSYGSGYSSKITEIEEEPEVIKPKEASAFKLEPVEIPEAEAGDTLSTSAWEGFSLSDM